MSDCLHNCDVLCHVVLQRDDWPYIIARPPSVTFVTRARCANAAPLLTMVPDRRGGLGAGCVDGGWDLYRFVPLLS